MRQFLYVWNLQSHEIAMNGSFHHFALVQRARFASENLRTPFGAPDLSQNTPELDRGINWMSRKLTAHSPSFIGFNAKDGG
jgi:hypothetical protein